MAMLIECVAFWRLALISYNFLKKIHKSCVKIYVYLLSADKRYKNSIYTKSNRCTGGLIL